MAVQLLAGWPWWGPAAAVVAAAWLPFASTALRAAGGPGPSLATDLLRVVHPRRATERFHRAGPVSDLEPYVQGQHRPQEAWVLHQDQDR